MNSDFIYDPSLVFYLPLYLLDGATIMDRSAYGHSCAVTNAIWTPSGRTFDGTDDIITTPNTTDITNIWTGGASFVAWINPASDGEGNLGLIIDKTRWYLRVQGETAGFVYLYLYRAGNTQNGAWTTDSAIVPIGSFSQIAITFNDNSVANDPIIYFNGNSTPITETTPCENPATDAAFALNIGDNDGSTRCFDGTIGEVRIYSRCLNPLEIQRNYETTKFRYR